MALQQAEYGTTDLAMQQAAGRYAGDEHLLVRFFTLPRYIQHKSEAEGRPIYEDTPYVEIMQPGNKDSIIRRPATEMDKNRFAEHYKKFQAREDQSKLEGTPLAEWPGVTRSQVEELKYLNILTVEQLANTSDSNAQNIMGVQLLKQKAVKYLADAEKGATADALAAAEARMAAMQEQIDALLKGGMPVDTNLQTTELDGTEEIPDEVLNTAAGEEIDEDGRDPLEVEDSAPPKKRATRRRKKAQE